MTQSEESNLLSVLVSKYTPSVISTKCPTYNVVCLNGVSSHSRISHSYGDLSITDEGCKFWPMLTLMAIEQWGLEQWGFFSVHAYCDTGHPLKMVISEELWHLHLLLTVWQWSCHYLFLRLFTVCRAWDSNTKPSAYGANVLTDCATVAVSNLKWLTNEIKLIGLLAVQFLRAI